MKNGNGEVDFLIMQEWDSYLLFENSDNSEIFLIPPLLSDNKGSRGSPPDNSFKLSEELISIRKLYDHFHI
jgi:hypothetical protein